MFESSQTILLGIVGELAGRGSMAVAVRKSLTKPIKEYSLTRDLQSTLSVKNRHIDIQRSGKHCV